MYSNSVCLLDPLFFQVNKTKGLRPTIFGGDTAPENGTGLTTVEMHLLPLLLAFEVPLVCLYTVDLEKTEFSVQVD